MSALRGYTPQEAVAQINIPIPTNTGFIVGQQASMNLLSLQVAAREELKQWRTRSVQKKWEIAQEADRQGNLRLASQMYMDVALSSASNKAEAQQWLAKIQSSFLARWQPLEDQLAEVSGGPARALRPVKLDAAAVTQVVEEMEKLELEYAGVATIEERIDQTLSKVRKNPKFTAVLQEPAAAELWATGQEHEAKKQLCCAALVYEEAVKLAPAPSAARAKARLAELQADASVADATKRCRNLQLCHAKFDRAKQIKDELPDQARKYYGEILQLAPPETPIYQAAREQIALLSRTSS